MDLLPELFQRVCEVGEEWGNIESVHLTIQDLTGKEHVFQCPHISENMGTVLELYFEYIHDQANLTRVIVGAVWFKTGNILRFTPNELMEKLLSLSGHWKLIELPPNPKDVECGCGVDWLFASIKK